MRIAEHLAEVADRLAREGIPDSALEAEVLLRHVLDVDRAHLFASMDSALSAAHQKRLGLLVTRRSEGEPLAYIVGHREFYGLDFIVNEHVLVPRQETELLVDIVLDVCTNGRVEIADVGTGCGAIAVAIAYNIPDATVYAVDVSREALRVADTNRRRHDVADRVHLIQGDLLGALDRPLDLVVSNPPYIDTAQLPGLASEVLREPRGALDGGPDGVAVTRRLLRQAAWRVKPAGRVLVEISPEQLDAVASSAREAMPDASVSHSKDLLGLSRVVSVERTPSAR